MIAIAAVPIALAASQNIVADTPRLLPPHAVACGAPTLDVSAYDLVGVHETGLRHPDLPAGLNVLTFSIDQWRCIYPMESAARADVPTVVGVGSIHEADAHGRHPANDGFGTLHDEGTPKTGAHNGYMKIVIILPDPSDPLYPSAGCNWDDVGQAMIQLNNNVGGGSYERWCYYAPSPGWNSGGDTNTDNNLNRLHSFVHASHPHWIDDSNEFVLGVLEQMDNNGVAWEPSKFGILAESPTSGVNLWDDGVVLHEVSHGFGASHYPFGGNPNVCGWESTVMNYCDIAMGVMHYDNTNDNTVTNQYWSW